MEFTTITTIWAFINSTGGDVEAIANFILIFAFLKWAWGFRKRSFEFNDGEKSFTVIMRAKDVNPQTLTNIVSASEYKGGHVPLVIRDKIISYTAPKYWVVKG